jgi:hypothetical protein
MKKCLLTIIFLLICVGLYATETASIKLSWNYPRELKSNGKTLTNIEIKNTGDIALYDLELSFINDDGLEIISEITKIGKIDAKKTIILNLEIINNHKYYFNKETFIDVKIANNELSEKASYLFTIKPVDNFWFFIILSISLILTVFFVFIFIKINKGDENVR